MADSYFCCFGFRLQQRKHMPKGNLYGVMLLGTLPPKVSACVVPVDGAANWKGGGSRQHPDTSVLG
jgi:hypothetical protein